MIKTKHIGLVVLASTSFLFSGCVQQPDTFSNHNGYYNNAPRVNVSLVSYGYPYYYDRPYYFLNGLYYYGGYYRNGFYHYGHRIFRHGHYYSHGNRYYNGRRYRARNGVHGYYRNRGYYERSHAYRVKKHRSLDRGQEYDRRGGEYVRHRTSHVGKTRVRTVRTRDTYKSRESRVNARKTTHRTKRTRSRPVR